MSLQELIERVEKASGYTPEIDARIDAWLKGRTGFEWLGYYYKCNEVAGACGGTDVEHWSASLDAVLQLVERKLPGWHWVLQSEGPTPPAAQYAATLIYLGDDLSEDTVTGVSRSTPALALLLAMLRALQAQETPLR